ncbi:PalH-domain-containing protein [Acephala macrosclerotiorum]|nr:PalH-domain-containing protein [Acephala macrosclerotiorum]
MEARQIINIAKPTKTSTTARPHCTPFTLPSNGILTLGVSNVITLTSDAVFKPECTGSTNTILTGSSSPSYLDLRDPFYASTIPECYALAAATVIAYMLVIMLLITPRTFLHEGAVVLGRRGFTNGPSGSDAGIGIGGRPWLQKVAALTVAISLTIATADTFKVAEQQYEIGYMDAQALQNEVEDGTELKVIRVISDTFLWLAQAQTLIRLFPRQREKIIIKWTAFALITLDVLFSILNNFVYDGNSRPRSFVDAVPALAYLFQLALSLLYAAWVIYYSITKKRFAYYHPQMKNIYLVALLSLVAVLVPVVFFVLDISKPDLAGWGDYVRWVGAAAASVVVWEWVERIEALERDDKKDGVLGREVFDGDEMLEVGPSSESTWKYRLKMDDSKKGGGKGDGGVSTSSHGRHWPAMSGLANRYRPRATHDVETGTQNGVQALKLLGNRKTRPKPPLWPTRPPPTATPVSRTDTASAESTVYAIRYHPISEATPSVRGDGRPPGPSRANSLEIVVARGEHEDPEEQLEKSMSVQETEDGPDAEPAPDRSNAWQTLTRVNPFRRRAQDPPPEVSAHTVKPPEPINAHGSSHRWDIRSRAQDFLATQAEKFQEKKRPTLDETELPRTIIPAPPRRRNLTATLEELEHTERGDRPITGSSNTWVATPNTLSSRPPMFDSVENSRSPQPHRLSDPYTPSDLNVHSIHQRGAISFATADLQDREDNVPVSPVSLVSNGRDTTTVISSRGSHSLPFMSIPAPPRRPRSNEE